jgi:hypothetical protein
MAISTRIPRVFTASPVELLASDRPLRDLAYPPGSMNLARFANDGRDCIWAFSRHGSNAGRTASIQRSFSTEYIVYWN